MEVSVPVLKPHDLKAESSLALEPERMSSRIQLIIALDIAGYNGNQISENVGLSISRVSIIRNSPMYIQERERRWTELQEQVIGKKTDRIVAGDPVENRIKDLALRAVGVYEDILATGRSEIARKATADSVLDRAGYKPHTDKTTLSVEVTEKMADRFERVLKRTVITREG
jgi:hypothetical protein